MDYCRYRADNAMPALPFDEILAERNEWQARTEMSSGLDGAAVLMSALAAIFGVVLGWGGLTLWIPCAWAHSAYAVLARGLWSGACAVGADGIQYGGLDALPPEERD